MNKIFSIFRNSSGCRMNGGLPKGFDIFIISLLVMLTSSLQMSAQNELKGPGHNPPGPMVQTIDIQVPMPMERLNQQYTSDLIYNLPATGGTVTFAAYYDPVDPNTSSLSDLESLNNYLAGIQADTLMTFTSASTNTGQMWWDFTLQILQNDNTFSTYDQTKAARRIIHLNFPLSTGNTLQINVTQAEGADRSEPFPEWPDQRFPQTEPLINHTPNLQQDGETLTNWIRKATYIGDSPYTPNDSIVDIVWYNGLGQPKQTVQVGASANAKKNIVTPVEYDPVGQQLREYLPYKSTQATENYDANTATQQLNYYHSLYGNTENYPYTETLPEAATNRPIVQYAQGLVFRNATSLNETQNGTRKPRSDADGRYLATTYSLSSSEDSIPILLAEDGYIKNRGVYGQEGTEPLFKTVTVDQDGKTVATFTDGKEKTILVRTYLGGYADTTETGGWSDLVYVYDKRGLLSAVITPEGENERNKTAAQISMNSDWAKKRCYIYGYDGLGRMSSRRWPGKGKELFVTDPAGNVVATQDSLLRQSGRWRLTKYDKANRPVETLVTQQSITEAQMRSYFSYETVQLYFAQNENSLFTSPVYELSDNISLTKTETGKTDVSFNINQSLAISFKPEDQTVSLADVDTTKFSSVLWERTAMTMSKDGVLIGIAEDGSSNPGTVAQADILYRYTAYFYDCYARPIQTVTLYPDGTVFTASTKYNYTGLPIRQTARLQVPQGTNSGTDTLNVVLTEIFTYDKRGRMLTSNAAMQTFNSFVQGGNLTYSDTLSSAASATYSYDELGHLMGKTLGGNLSQTLAYNIQDWMTAMQTKKGTANVFSQTLRYYNPVKPSTTALYSGNISEWETVQGTSTASTYGFTYDTQGRLTSSDRYNGAATAATQLYTERDISYDRNGNILALKRISNSIPNPLHNFTYSYDGDKLTALSGSQSGTSFTSAYLYDGNGNMTLDGNQTVRLSYDINNLVHRVKKTATGQNPNPAQDELTATYSYFADGTKYYIKDTDGNGRIYIGPFTLTRKDYQSANPGNTAVQHITLLESADILGSDARFAFAATPQNPSGTDTTYTVAYETLYLLKDHLGSIRAITDSQGNALERNDYYPYGLQTSLGRSYATLGDKYRVRMPVSSTLGNPSISNLSISSPSIEMTPYRMLYNGKELQMIAQTRLIDYGARQYDPVIVRWNAPDSKSDIYHSNIYVFCTSDPTHRIDIDGNNDVDVNELLEEDLANIFDVNQDYPPDDPPDDPKKFSLRSKTTSIKTEKEILPQNPFVSMKCGVIETTGESKMFNNDSKTTTTIKQGVAGEEISTSIDHQFNASPIIGRFETGLSNSNNSGTFVKSSASVGVSFLDAANIQVGLTNCKNFLESTLFASITVNNPNYNQKYFFTVGVKPIGLVAIIAMKQASFSLVSIPNLATATQ
jgi:RHS repeat-associated protein